MHPKYIRQDRKKLIFCLRSAHINMYILYFSSFNISIQIENGQLCFRLPLSNQIKYLNEINNLYYESTLI